VAAGWSIAGEWPAPSIACGRTPRTSAIAFWTLIGQPSSASPYRTWARTPDLASFVVRSWRDAFEGLMGRIAGRFARVEPRRRAARLVLGLLADLPRKNCWTIAEWAGETTPDGMQHLLGRAKWDADQVRDDVCGYVVEHLHDDGAVLVVDETGDVKKGTGTVGVQRQYTGTAGRIENSQVAVYLVYAGKRGHAAVDRELYVPRS
jgi:SRSO17 transposase